MTRSPTFLWLTLVLVACTGDGGDDETAEQPTAEYACLHVAEGTIVDVSAERESAGTISLGREPYRVNLLPDVPGFLRVDTSGPTDVVVLLDHADALQAVWRGEDREEVAAAEPNPFCDEDIPAHYELSLASGANWLELGPVFQANVWLMVATP